MGPKSTRRLTRTLGPSLASLAQSSWSLLTMALVMGPLLGRIALAAMDEEVREALEADPKCRSNAFQGYFDDCKESRVKQSFK